MKKRVVVDRRNCSACGDCQAVCPQGILQVRKIDPVERRNLTLWERIDCLFHHGKRLEVIDQKTCLGCGLCLKACKRNGITLEDKCEPDLKLIASAS